MTLSIKAKAIKQVPDGWTCSLKAYRRLVDFICPEFLEDYKDWDDESILNMIKVETRLARRY